MKSILENRPTLTYAVNQVAEVAGYLWQKGWAERNGGNITLNITEFVDDEIKALPAISEVKQIGATLPYLKDCYFLQCVIAISSIGCGYQFTLEYDS